ncbi:MAG TPA: amidohydrolase family protein [Solirubrobacterales bacterium]
MIFDVQAHLFPPPYLEALEVVAASSDRGAETAREALESPLTNRDPIFTTDLPQRLELMDAAGVDVQALSFAAPNVWSDQVDIRRRVTSSFNDGIAEVVRQHPGRFVLLAALPVPFVDAAIEEAARAFDELDAAGVCVCTQYDGHPIDDRRFDDLYAYLDQRKATVLLHPEGFFVPGALEEHGMEWAIGTPFDDTVAAIRLVYGGVIDRYPGIEWIVPHLGGTLPFLARRLDFVWNLNPQVKALLEKEPTSYLRRLWYDTVNPDPRALALSADVLGVERLLYGSDFPFASRKDLGHGLKNLELAGIDGAQRREVSGDRAARLMLR